MSQSLTSSTPEDVALPETLCDLQAIIAGAGSGATGILWLLAEITVTWMPRGSVRSLAAGTDGLAYVTVHSRRPGMQIRSRPDHLPPAPPPHR